MQGTRQHLAEDLIQLVTLWLGGSLYGIDIKKVQEIDKLKDWTAVPRADQSILGILSLRGSIVTILDLATKLGLAPTKIGPDSRIVIVSSDGRSVGFVADQIASVVEMSADQLAQVPANLGPDQARFLEGVFETGPQVITVLKAEAIIDEAKVMDA